MIRIVPKNPPSDFDAKVRQQGLAFLASHGITSGPVPKDFPWKELWKKALEDLYDDYDEICAYSGMRIEYCQGGATVDHFMHKNQYPMLAYEWSNYRLASVRFNSLKSTSDEILDPFSIENGWFAIEFTNGKVVPNRTIKDSSIIEKVKKTINVLKLNRRRFRNKRMELYNRALATNPKQKLGMDILAQDAPFIYQEILRQGYATP